MRQAERFRTQAAACAELGSPLYAALFTRVADDIDAGGVAADVLAGYEDSPPGAAMALRLAGGVHRLVLTRQAPELALHYPSVGGTHVAGDASADDAIWSAFRRALVTHGDVVRDTLRRAPQTNETGRSLPLIGALKVISRRSGGLPVRLVEIGASAGLNLRAEQLGSLHAPADLAALPVGRPFVVVDRIGCDLDPLDPTTTEGRLTLSCYVWPDDLVRFERLRAALDIAARVPAVVKPSNAGAFLRTIEPAEGHVTVLWNSVMWQYLESADQDAVLAEQDRIARASAPTQPFAHVSFEPGEFPADPFAVTLRWSTGDELSEELLGTAPPHGVPVEWADRV